MLDIIDRHGTDRGVIDRAEDLDPLNMAALEAGDPAAPYALAPSALALLFEAAKARARAAVIAAAGDYAARLTEGYPRAEQESWTAKAAEAREIAGGAVPDTAQHPLIMTESFFTGRAPAEIAEAVLAKAERFARAAGAISGIRQAAFAAIDAAKDEAELKRVLAEAQATAEAAFAGIAG